MTKRLATSLLALATLLGGCDDGAPPPLDGGELAPALGKVKANLESEGYEVRAVATGERATPTLVVEGPDLVVVLIDRPRARAGLRATDEAVAEVIGEADGHIEIACHEVVVAGSVDARTGSIARATGDPGCVP